MSLYYGQLIKKNNLKDLS